MKNKMKKIILIPLLLIMISISLLHLNADTSEQLPILVVNNQTVEMDVGETYNLEDKFFGYIEDKYSFNWRITNEDSLYLVEENLKIYALKAGESQVTVESEDGSMSSSFTIIVRKINLYPNGDFENFSVNTKWVSSSNNIDGWRLYMGGQTDTAAHQEVKVDVVERDGVETKTIHASHDEVAYSTVYKDIPVSEPGFYYVELDIKGENITLQNVYGRINVNTPTATQTTGMRGTFDWQTFQSDIVEVTGSTLRVELYGANFAGSVWYDNVGIYKVVKKEYFGYDLNTALIDLKIDEEFVVEPKVNLETPIDFVFYYEVLDENVATVDSNGVVTGVSNGVTELIVVDKVLQLEKRVYIMVGDETNLVSDPVNITMKEDATETIEFEFSGNEKPVKVYKYINPTFGNYYVKNDTTIVYAPNRDFNSEQVFSQAGELTDNFKVVLFEEGTGYIIVDVEVFVEAEEDEVEVVEFWQSTNKAVALSDGYVQVFSRDIESEIPLNTETALKNASLFDHKVDAYKNVVTTLSNGELVGESIHGGSIQIHFDGEAQLIKDRYHAPQNKVIFGMKYTYEPADDFFGYDYFDITVKLGEQTTNFRVTIYVSPDVVDFKFDEVDFSGFYVLGNDDWVKETREAYQNGDIYITRWLEEIEANYLVYNPTGVPANARGPLENLGVLYQVTGNKRYADLAWSQLHEVTKDNTLIPGSDGTKRASWGQASNGFLDAAMATYSFAVAYNMIYDTLTEAQRTQVVRALYEEGFQFFESIANPNVLLHGNNHNLLINPNMAVAALSVMSYEGELDVTVAGGDKRTIDVQEMAANVVSTAYQLLQIGLVHYSPSGGFPEGPSYSYYAHRNIISLLSTLKNIYGGDSFEDLYDFGLSSIGGIINYPKYALYTSTPNNDVFYYNEGSGGLNQPGLLWYARMNDEYIPYTLINKMSFERGENNVLGLLWYKPGSFDNLDVSQVRPLDQMLDVHEVASFRNSLGDEYGIFAALKGFNPTSSLFTHKSLDSGTFELVAFGEKFIENFSDENYQVSVPPGFWDYDVGRWMYYKKQPQGHNTVIFNPVDYPIFQQDPYEKAPITTYESSVDGGYGIVDLTNVYKDNVLTYERGLMLSEDRSVVTLQDEFTLRKESELYWSVHTLANIEIINDQLAALSLNGKKVYVRINGEIGSFQKMAAIPLPGTVGNYFNLQNEGVNKLIIHVDNIIEGTISVSFIPSMEDIKHETIEAREVVALNEWELAEKQELSDIRVNDISFNAETGNQFKYEFVPYRYTYLVRLAQSEQFVPKLNVSYDEDKYSVEIHNSQVFGELSTVKVTNKQTNETKTYTYRFITDFIISGFEDFTEHEVSNIISDSLNPEFLIDGIRANIWRSSNREEVIFEFAEEQRITNVKIRFAGGISYQYFFDIYAGNSLDDLKPVYFAGNSNYQLGDEVYTLGEVNAKYVKVVFNGNNENYETSVSNIAFYNNNMEPIEENETKSNNNVVLYTIIGVSIAAIGGGIATTLIIIKKKRGVV